MLDESARVQENSMEFTNIWYVECACTFNKLSSFKRREHITQTKTRIKPRRTQTGLESLDSGFLPPLEWEKIAACSAG